jgi:hypothetical protein
MRDDAHFVLPRAVVSASAAAWGIVGGQVLAGLVLAALLQLPALLRWRLELERVHFYRAADLTSVGFAAFAIYEFNGRGLLGIYGILAGIPLSVAPLVLLSAYSEQQAIPASALALSIRRRVLAGAAPEIWLDPGPAFVALCLLAASGGKLPAPWFDLLAAAALCALLAAARPRRSSFLRWGTALVCAGALGLGTAAGLVRLHAGLEDALQSWFTAHWYAPDFDRATTSIGRLGRLKLSDVVRLRVRTTRPLSAPLLIGEASYQTFRLGTWSTEARRYEAVDAEPGGGAWRLAPPAPGPVETLEIDLPQAREVGILPLPLGARRLVSDQIIEIRRNAIGAVQAEAAPGQVRFRVETGATVGGPPPQAADLVVPAEYASALRTVGVEIGLEGLAPQPALVAIQRFFAEHFRYSLVQRGFFPGRLPLSAFLLHDRHGHCEYFASATVLLLRHAGIPARYAVGYGVDEYSRLEAAYVARARHAHAWALAWIDGRWAPIDTTPALWYELESDAAGATQWVSDLWSWAEFRLARLRLAVEALDARILLGFAAALVVVLAWRLRGQIRARRDAAPAALAASLPDPALRPLFAALAARGLTPQPGETVGAFLERLLPARSTAGELRRLVALYYRNRFRAGGLSEKEQAELVALAADYVRAAPGTTLRTVR